MTEIKPNRIIGKNIKELREKLGLTQEELAQYLNSSREQISYYENGVRSVPSSQLGKLADLFCLDEIDFYEDDVLKRRSNIAFAFRADSLYPEDIIGVARFKKIVRNYLNMKDRLVHE
jgi:transcriptional regulator with XRE-family HTH domain